MPPQSSPPCVVPPCYADPSGRGEAHSTHSMALIKHDTYLPNRQAGRALTKIRTPECFKEYADLLTWDKYWHTSLDTSKAPFWKWFVGGRLNASYNCVDRHLARYRNKAAIIWVPEPESEMTQAITYQELYKRVNEFAALLRDFCGLKQGDRVTFRLPMVPDLPVSMLACAPRQPRGRVAL